MNEAQLASLNAIRKTATVTKTKAVRRDRGPMVVVAETDEGRTATIDPLGKYEWVGGDPDDHGDE